MEQRREIQGKRKQENPAEIKNKIVGVIREKGPSLPVHISSQINQNLIFTGAYLSELAAEKIIKISHMKIGGSPLYLLPGQEEKLGKFHIHLPGKEKQAFGLLSQKKILQDSMQEPGIRVALRNLKDFALPFTFIAPNGKILFWRFYAISENEVRKMFEKIKPEAEVKKPQAVISQQSALRQKPEVKPIISTQKTIKNSDAKPKEKEVLPDSPPLRKIDAEKTEKPLLKIKPAKSKTKKQKEKSEFVKKIISFLKMKNLEIMEELELKKKEYQAIVRINSDLGKIKFLCIAKDKKRVTENDFNLASQKSQAQKMPVLFLSPGEPNKKAQAYLEDSNLIIYHKIMSFSAS